MSGSPWTWSLFAIYLVFTSVLAWRGGRISKGTSGFAIGSGRMNPWLAGITLGACRTEAARGPLVLEVPAGQPVDIDLVGDSGAEPARFPGLSLGP